MSALRVVAVALAAAACLGIGTTGVKGFRFLEDYRNDWSEGQDNVPVSSGDERGWTDRELLNLVEQHPWPEWGIGMGNLVNLPGYGVGETRIGPEVDHFQEIAAAAGLLFVPVIQVRHDVVAFPKSSSLMRAYNCEHDEPSPCEDRDGRLGGIGADSFRDAYVLTVPRSYWDAHVAEYWDDVSPCDDDDAQHTLESDNKAWLCSLLTPTTAPMLYGSLTGGPTVYGVSPSGLGVDLRIAGAREVMAAMVVASLGTYGCDPGETCAVHLGPKPGWWAYHASGDPSCTWTVPAGIPSPRSWQGYSFPGNSCGDGGPLFPTQYDAGEWQLAHSESILALRASLDAAGYSEVEIVSTESPDYEDRPWSTLSTEARMVMRGVRLSGAGSQNAGWDLESPDAIVGPVAGTTGRFHTSNSFVAGSGTTPIADTDGAVGEDVSLDCDDSTPRNRRNPTPSTGSITACEWFLGASSLGTTTPGGGAQTVNVPADGRSVIRLEVTNDLGFKDSGYLIVDIGSDAADSLTPSATAAGIQGATCVAPCVVKFDASATTDSDYARAFHTHDFRWHFDDQASGEWRSARTLDGRSRDAARGPLAAHVYETPGSYAPVVEITAPDGGTKRLAMAVTVTDPDAHFASPFCFANSAGTFEGCPLDTDDDGTCEDQPGNCVTTTVGAAALLTTCDVDAGRARCLFRGGDTFTLDASIPLSNGSGPALWGSFGTGRAIFEVDGSFDAVSCGDGWTLFDLALRGDPACTGSACGGIAHASGCDAFTLYDFELSGFKTSPIASGTGGAVQQGLAIVDSDVSFASTYTGSGPSVTAFLRAHDLVILGSVLDGNGAGQFALRYDGSGATPVGGAVICNTDFLGSSGRGPVTIRGDHPLGVFCQNSLTFTAGQNDVLTVCADDECGSPDGAEAPTDWIFDTNLFGGGTVDTDPFAVIELEGRDLTLRNNVIDLSGAPGSTSVQVFRLRDQNTGDGSTVEDVHLLGNTVYHSAGGPASWRICAIDAGVSTTGHLCWGNLAWVGTQGTQTKAGVGFDEDSNVLAVASPFAAPVPSPSTYEDFKLGSVSGSCGLPPLDCVGEGPDYSSETEAFLQRDGYGTARAPTWDVGAHEP